MMGLEGILNEGIWSYTQVSHDFRLDSTKKLVLMEILSVFPLLLLPCLMDTLQVWYQWHRSFPIKITDIYRKMVTNTFYQYGSSLSMITPICNFTPSMHQVLQQFSINSESFGSGFEGIAIFCMDWIFYVVRLVWEDWKWGFGDTLASILNHTASIQVLWPSYIDGGSGGSGFEVRFYGFLVGYQGYGSFNA